MELLIGLFMCGGALAVFVVVPAVMLLALAKEDYRGLRRVLRERRFGLFSAFLMTAIVAIAMGVLRGLGVEFNDPSVICLGVFGLGVGIVVVGLAWLMLSDRLERGESRKMKEKVRTPDIQVGPPAESYYIQAELADSPPSDKLD